MTTAIAVIMTIGFSVLMFTVGMLFERWAWLEAAHTKGFWQWHDIKIIMRRESK